MSVAWLFPGQGAQKVGMGRDLFEAFSEARAVFETADEALGRPLSTLIFEGPEDELRQTRNTQPAILVTSLATLAAAQAQGHPLTAAPPAFLAGHSLGEYSALVAAEALTAAEAVRLVQTRGELMQRAGEERPGTLAAVLGLSLADVKSLCDESGAELCNINSDSQLVIGGTPEAVAAASTLAEERGARRVVALNVSGAFHSSLMAPAAEGMRETLREAEIGDPRLPVIANVSVEPLRDAEAVRSELGEQVRNPVRWSETVQRLVAEGADSFVEIGPGNVLTGLVRSIARPLKPTLVNLNSVESMRDESAENAE